MDVIPGDVDVLMKDPPRKCEGTKTYLVPISKSTYGQLSVEPFVIAKENVEVRELVFDLFHFTKEDKLFQSGLACFNIHASDAKGNTTSVSVPIAIFSVLIDRTSDKAIINFQIKPYENVYNLAPLLVGSDS